jgi:hypothetical protein
VEDCVLRVFRANTRFQPAQALAFYASSVNSQSHPPVAPGVSWELTRTLRARRPQPPALHARQGPFQQLWAHLRPLHAWFASPESIQIRFRRAVLLVVQDRILRHSQLNVRPARPVNSLLQRLLTAWFASLESIQIRLRRAVLLVVQDRILRHYQLNVRPARLVNSLLQRLLTALHVTVVHGPGCPQLPALLVNLEGIRAHWGLRHLLPVCSA